MRSLLTLSVLVLLAPSASGQDLRIVDPILSVDGQRVTTLGAPLVQRQFSVLTMRVPGFGTYTVGTQPFEGARLAGQFEGDGLVFAQAGQSVRLRSREAILGDGARRPAYVRFEASPRGGSGPARLSIADAPDGRGDRNSEPMPVVAERVLGPVRRGPAPAPPARVSTQTAQLRAETARLRGDLDRLIAERQSLAEQRARLATERDAALRAQQAAEEQTRQMQAARAATAGRAQADLLERERALSQQVQNSSDLTRRLTVQRDRLAAERDALLAERNELIAARTATEAARAGEAARFLDLQTRLEAAEARAARAPSGSADLGAARADAARLRAESDGLRAQLVHRDATIQMLRDQRDARTGQAETVGGSLAGVQAQLTTARVARDAAIAERDGALRDLAAARGERDQALEAGDTARAERDALRVRLSTASAERTDALRELDALRAQIADRDAAGSAPNLAAEVTALRAQLAEEQAARTAAVDELERERNLLRAERAAIGSIPRREGTDAERAARIAALDAREAALAERERLVQEQTTMAGDRSQLAGELADARAEIARLRTELDAARAVPSTTSSTPSAPENDAPRNDASNDATASLPGFDFARLANPDVIRRRLDEVSYPRWAEVGRIEGDVLVLFQTDPSGAVIRTAVPTPLGGGLDLLAEDLVRQMRFDAPTVDGQATGLRSQVTVRFQL